MSEPTYTLYCGDCLDYMRGMDASSVDAVITDPVYPNHDVWGFVSIDFLDSLKCRQLIFWTAIDHFPLDHTAVHIWDKRINGAASSEYERIFERNGGGVHRVFRYYFINSTVAASYGSDVFTGHPSQKPIKLLRMLIENYTHRGDTIFDPFMGSGTTGVACMQLGRNFIGCEIDPAYYAIAERRIKDAAAQPPLFTLDAPVPKYDQAALMEL